MVLRAVAQHHHHGVHLAQHTGRVVHNGVDMRFVCHEGGALGALAPQHGDARGQAAAALLGRKIGEPGKSEGVEVVRADHANAQHTESLLTD